MATVNDAAKSENGTTPAKPGVRKRARKIWSCLECRRKKLLCDHGLPACGRCTRAGRASSCVYTDGPKPTPGSKYPVANQDEDALKLKVRRLEDELRLLKTVPSNGDNEGSRSGSVSEPTPYLCSGMVPNTQGGSGFRTNYKYNGGTSAACLAEHIPGLAGFMADAPTQFGKFDQVLQYINTAENRATLACSESSTELSLRSLIPARTFADHLIETYMGSFDRVYPLIDLAEFQKGYDSLWQIDSVVAVPTLLQALLVMAIAMCLLSRSASTTEESRKYRAQAIIILDSCQTWLNFNIERYYNLDDFSNAFLMLLGKQLIGLRNKRTWANSGGLIRVCMCAGLHRHPDLLPRESTAAERIRRCIMWSSAAEFELQAAFEHGMPAVEWSSQADMPGLSEEEALAQDHSSGASLRYTFLSQASSSLQLRHELNNLLNDIRAVMSSQSALEYTVRLQKELKSATQELKHRNEPAHALICILLHQYILAIHERQLRHATSPAEKQYARVHLVESAVQMLDLHQAISKSGDWTIESLCAGHHRAALSICYALSSCDMQTDRVFTAFFEQEGLRYMLLALELLSDKAPRVMHIWLVSAALGLTKTKMNPALRDAYLREAVEHFVHAFRRLPSPDQGVPNDAGAHVRTIDAAGAYDMNMASTQMSLDVLPMANFDVLTEWNFDDWSFEPGDFLSM